jgi:hypothetical protein
MEFTALGADSGFTSGDFRATGYFAAVPAYQQVFICDGRPYSATMADSGYHRIDMANTSLVGGTVTGTFTEGEAVTQATSLAAGLFVETVGSGATARHLIYRTSTIEFVITETVTGADSLATLAGVTDVHAPPHWLNWILKTGTGYEANLFPDGGSNISCLFDGRIWLNSMWNPHQWIASRQGDPFDFDTSQDIEDVQAAFSSQTSNAGLLAEPLVAFIPYKDTFLIFGATDSLWVLRGGSTGGGGLSNITFETGVFGPESWCWDNKGTLYVVGMNGLFKFPSGAILSEDTLDNITTRLLPNLFKTIKLNRKTDRVVMGFDRIRNLINVSITMQDGSWAVNFVYDPTLDAIYPDEYPAAQVPASYFYSQDSVNNEIGLWLGGYDGYIRKFDEATLNDDGTAITSYTFFGPIFLGEIIRANVKVKEIEVILSEDTTNVSWYLYSSTSAEKLKSDIEDGVSPVAYGTITSGGRQFTIRDKVAGEFIGILFMNNVTGTTWACESIRLQFTLSGKVKDGN